MSELPPHEERRIASWSLGRLAEAVDGSLAEQDTTDSGLRGISTDTRTLEHGEVFVAIRGENFDGHDFVVNAAESGAHGAVVQSGFEPSAGLPSGFALIYVDDTREALAELGRAVWREAIDDGAHTVAVTGSNGKTTTKELLRAVWSARGDVFATPGNLNNEIGLPLTLCALPESADHLVFEMGANAPGEISELIEMAPGGERIITSIGYAHTEGFGSIEGIREAKSEIFERADSDTVAIVPEAERDRLLLDDFPGRIWTFGEEVDADLRLLDYLKAGDGPGSWEAVYDASGFDGAPDRFSIELALPGRHNGLNLAASLLTLVARGVSIDSSELGRRLQSIDLPAGRWRTWRREGLAVIDDAYNANPSSVRASFSAFVDSSPPSDLDDESPARLAVLGEMHELGDEAERWHRKVAAELVAADTLDGFCAVGKFAGAMIDAAEHQSGEIELVSCKQASGAAEWLVDRRPAFVWMKASRANGLEQVIELIEQMRDDG
jgi:UDP-N-acetylmuramoyl-tripeptide--D-alanyl-D-alanine ligase